jgi:tripartite-type tricarboxylate transporter receptor subunit TctC
MKASVKEPSLNGRRRQLNAAALGALGLAFAGRRAWAETAAFPTRPLRLIVPYVPGGVIDATARMIAEKMSIELGQAVVVDNRGGAGGNIGSLYAAQADPDGYSMILMPDANVIIAPQIFKNIGYDPFKDFAPVGKIGDSTLVVVSSTTGHLNTLKDVIAAGKSSPQGLFYATTGVGSNGQIAGELLRHQGVKLVHAPYNRGMGPALIDVIGGQIPLAISAPAGALPLIKAGRLHAVCVVGANRLPSLPDVPTAREAGVPVAYNYWMGVFAPAKTPPRVLARLTAALKVALANPETNSRLAELGIFPQLSSTPETFAEEIRRDFVTVGDIVRKARITIE